MSQQHPTTRLWSVIAVLAVVTAILAAPGTTPGQATPTVTPEQNGLLVNGPNALVTAVANIPTVGQTYVAGDFTRWGPQTGGMAVVNNTTGALNNGFPAVLGYVRAAVPDGAGGVYIGGTFSHVGGVPRNNAAHILANGTVDPNWNPNPVGAGGDVVLDMARIGSDVILAGRFTLDGQTVGVTKVRPDGTRTPGFSDALLDGSDSVYNVTTDGVEIYVVGQFSAINGTPRGNVAALDASTGYLQSWNPNASGSAVNGVEILGDSIIIGGDFGTVGEPAVSVPNLAAFGRLSGSLKSGWVPAPNGRVTAMAVNEDGSQLYVVGDFSEVAGNSRTGAAGLEPDTDAAPVLTGWSPEVSGLPFTVRFSNSGVYLAGPFTEVNGQSVPGVARVTADTGTLDAGWDPPDPAYSTSGGPEYVWVATPLEGSQVLLGGTFIVMGGVTRNRVAALDNSGNLLNTFSVGDGPDGRVHAMTLADGKLFLGGSFSTVEGQERDCLAAVDPNTGALDAWGSSLNIPECRISAMVADGNELLIGGTLTSVGGMPAEGLAGIDLTTVESTGWASGALTALPRSTTLDVTALALTYAYGPRQVYAGGSFMSPTGNNFVGLQGTEGAVIDGLPGTDGQVRSLSIAGDRIYLAGLFSQVGSDAAPTVAAVNMVTKARANWDGATNTQAQAISADADQVMVGGPFDGAFGSATVRGLAAGSPSESAPAIDWNLQIPNFSDGDVHALQVVPDPDTGVDDRVLIGAEMAIVDGAQLRFYYADVNSGIAAAPPRNVTAVAGGASGLVDLDWDAPSTLGPGVTDPIGYRIWTSTPPYTTWSLAVGNTYDSDSSAVVPGLTDNTRYRFRVAALTDQDGTEVLGGLSAPSNFAFPQNPARRPGAPQNVTALGEPESPGTGMIKVNAQAPASWGSGSAKGFRTIASVNGIPMGYCQQFDGVEVLVDCFITGLTLGSDYDVVAKAANSRNIWGPSRVATGSPVDALSLERPTGFEPIESPSPEAGESPLDLSPSTRTDFAPPQQTMTRPRSKLAKSQVTRLQVRAIAKIRGARGPYSVVAKAKVRPAQARFVQLQRKVCTKQSDQRMCLWTTVAQRRAGESGSVVLRTKQATRKAAVWRVFLPGTKTALPAVSRTVRR